MPKAVRNAEQPATAQIRINIAALGLQRGTARVMLSGCWKTARKVAIIVKRRVNN